MYETKCLPKLSLLLGNKKCLLRLSPYLADIFFSKKRRQFLGDNFLTRKKGDNFWEISFYPPKSKTNFRKRVILSPSRVCALKTKMSPQRQNTGCSWRSCNFSIKNCIILRFWLVVSNCGTPCILLTLDGPLLSMILSRPELAYLPLGWELNASIQVQQHNWTLDSSRV